MSNLSKHELADLSWLHLRDADDELLYAEGPDGEPDPKRPMRLELYGPGTKQYSRAQADQNNRNVERYQRKGKIKLTSEERVRERAEFVAAVTKSMENIESDHGNTGDDLHMEVYLNIKLSHWAEQAEAHARNTANFKQASSSSSSSTSAKTPG